MNEKKALEYRQIANLLSLDIDTLAGLVTATDDWTIDELKEFILKTKQTKDRILDDFMFRQTRYNSLGFIKDFKKL